MESNLRQRNILTLLFIITGSASYFSTSTVIQQAKCRTFSQSRRQEYISHFSTRTCR